MTQLCHNLDGGGVTLREPVAHMLRGAYLRGAPPQRLRVWDSRRAWLWGVCLPLVCLTFGLVFGPWGWVAWLIYPPQVICQTMRMRNTGPLSHRATLALFQMLARFPECCGQVRFICGRSLGQQARLIEYK